MEGSQGDGSQALRAGGEVRLKHIESVKVLDDQLPGEDVSQGVRGVGGVGAPPEVDHLLLPDIGTQLGTLLPPSAGRGRGNRVNNQLTQSSPGTSS